ncbi:MAG: ion transporter, partial [Candidatus Poribacteria bacterium]
MAESTIDENAAEEEGAAEEAAEESAATEDEGADADAAEAGDEDAAEGSEGGGEKGEGSGEEGEEEEEVIPRVPLRQRFDAFLNDAMLNEESPAYLIQSNLIILVILYSIGSILVESVPSIYRDYKPFFAVTEVIVVAIFVIEYAANIYVTKPWTAHALGKWGIIDFLAVAPSILSWITIPGLNVLQFAKILRILRFLRLMRLLKLTKGAKSDFKKLAGVTLLGSGVPFLAGGILLPLPQGFKVIMGCAGFVMIGIGDLIYLGSLHIKPLSEEEQARRNRQVFLSQVARARGVIK